jgi:two-component system invasion response regulator UvrY
MIRLLIADDHAIVREGLKRIAAECGDINVVDEAADAKDVLEKIGRTDVDVLLLDVSMPGPGFLETMRRIRTKNPKLPVLVLSVHPEEQYAIRTLRAGASGYLTKEYSPQELTKAIRQVFSGRKYVTSALAERLANELDSDGDRPLHETLSERELQVFVKLGCGKSISEIAEALHLSPKTVSTYRTRIMEKMRFKNNAEIIRYAVDHSLSD